MHWPTKQTYIISFVILNLVLTAVLATAAIHNRSRSQATLISFGKATQYVCNTTNILDVIVRQASSQLETNFKLGEYARLEQAGILSKHDIAVARHDLILYKGFDKELQKNSQCQFTISK